MPDETTDPRVMRIPYLKGSQPRLRSGWEVLETIDEGNRLVAIVRLPVVAEKRVE